jgi:UDP-GlcNAc:undecaprenyl-phosphate GlcNAc-1-phosphate transferase
MLLYPILALLLAVTAMPLCIRLAKRYGLLDRPDEQRKMHAESVPFTGGYGIIASFAVAMSAMLLLEGVGFFSDQYANFLPMYLYIAEATLIIVILGVIDDLRELTYSQKFFFQFIAAFLMILGATKSNLFPSVFSIENSGVLVNSIGMVISLLWLVGTTNAINMIDGMDGLAGTTSLISAVALAMVAFLWGNPVIGFMLLTLSGAILGFLMFNTHPARIFMGDGGSMFIGFVLAFSGWIIVDSGPDDIISILVPIIILGLPVTDTLLAFFRRIMRGNNPFSADLLHIHHMVKDRFHLSLGRAVSVLAAMSGLYALAGIAVAVLPPTLGWVLIGLLVAGKVVFLHALGYTELVLPALKKLRPEKAGLSSEQNLFLKETSGVSANGNGIHANGNGVHANGNGIHANGNGVHANGNGIHVNGNGVHANGNGIHANGNGVRKNGNGAAKGKPDTKSHDGDRDADSDAA